MKVTPKNIRKFLVGGPMGPEEVPVEEAPMGGAPEAGGKPDKLAWPFDNPKLEVLEQTFVLAS